MTACENKEKQEENTYGMTYGGTELALKGIEGEASLYYIKDSRIYILNSQQGAGQFYKVDLDGCSSVAIGKSIPERERVNAFLLGNAGDITYVASCGEEESQYELVKLDADGKEVKLDTDLDIMSDCITDGMDYDFYYKHGGIYGYDIDEKQSTKLLDNAASYMTYEELNSILPAGDGRFIGMMYGIDGPTSVLGMYTKIDPSVLENKQTIIYGCGAVGNKLRKAAGEFCRKNKDYRIEFKIYETEDDENYSTRMPADIVAGKVPDIIDITCLGLSPEQCVRKGLLEDLTPYYESDSEVSPADLIPSVAEDMKIDGKFYFLSPYFSIHTAVGKTKDVGNGTGWTFDEVKALLMEKGDGVMLFDSNGRLEALYYFLLNGLTDFINWETGECRFNSQEFKDILELCNRGDEKPDDSVYENTRFKEGKILLQAFYSSISPADIQIARQMFGEDITCIGYPDKNKQSSYFDFTIMTGIYSKSPVKEKAWEFLRLVMTKEYQTGSYL